MAIDVADRTGSRGAVWYAAYTATLIGVMIAAGVRHHDPGTVGYAYLVTLLATLGWCGFVGSRPAGPTLPVALCLVGAETGAVLAADTGLAAGDRGDLAGLGILLAWLTTTVMYGLTVMALLTADTWRARVRRLRRWDGWSWRYPLIWAGLVLAGFVGFAIPVTSSARHLGWIIAAGLGAVSLAVGAREGAARRWATVPGMLLTAAAAVAAGMAVTMIVGGVGRVGLGAPVPLFAAMEGLSVYGVLTFLFATGVCAGGVVAWLVKRLRSRGRRSVSVP